MGKRKLYIISLDAFGADDLAFAKTLPHFQEIINRSALVKEVESVYPSLTYVAHTSIATGMYPNRHGVIHNTHLQPERQSPDWYWYAKEIKKATIFDVAKQAGYTVCALLWPVTGKSPSIDYNLAEIFPNRPWQTQVTVSAFASSMRYALAMNKKFGKMRNGIAQPELDEFITAIAVDTIKTKQPDLMAVHLVDLDSMRHGYGVLSNQAKEAIVRMDRHLGQIMDAMKESGIFEDTVFAVLGDHYQIDTHTVIRPNHLFLDKGWQTLDKKKDIKDWKVLAKAADGACYIYRRDDSITNKMILDALKGLDDRIDTIYSAKEASKMGADENCLFMIEAKRGYYFESDVRYPFMESTAKSLPDRKLHKATHGFSPKKKNYGTMLLLSGPGIDADAVIEKGRLVDEGPTFLHAIGLKFPEVTDGRVINKVFL
ncbi:type i phosphodiesterase/nucleotide pyrophosphatase/phosphate transferase [Trichococcus palustris]|jgi:predicted AlkP superfamily pyrophosphatase or phosphodiesterase|uniref:Type i phosphodiesterase/nucleotide pyrophosphatase/phosphate transferase n=1 Tax=Trichococcus palustris TaxID=140314 RepID=A0A143Y474_9LACT|nr:ectonucleotide pyrophosphatase/phosphodiesterase [Trichococcus palustris]CZQ81225.1 type i phosphodiesterase/nucleotide pyrophosphatase/phosphate transferase [Trichococcus palustris]SFK63039.1 Predicted pyrophosphatase or phosphodiesterase, AlkP superfamily [Trichococcus palustris]